MYLNPDTTFFAAAAFFLRGGRLRRQGHRADHADRLAQAARGARVAQLQGPPSGMMHDLARPAAGPAAKGLDAHRLAACVQHTAHQREQVEGEHAQRGMQRVGVEVAARGMRRAEAAAKLADAVFGILAPAAASAERPRIAPPVEARRQRPVDVAALRQRVAVLRAVELELLLAGLSPPLHDHGERLGRVVHRVQEARRLLRLARRPVALDEGLPPRLVQRPGLPDHALVEPGPDRVADAPAREMVDDLRLVAGRVDSGAMHLDALGQGALALADELEVARVRRGRAVPELRRRHAGLGDMADDRHAAPLFLACELARRLLAVRRGRVDVQGRPFAAVQRDRQQSAVRQHQGRAACAAPRRSHRPKASSPGSRRMPSSSSSGRSSRSCFTPLRCREPSCIISMNIASCAPGRKPRLLPGSGISRSKCASRPSLRISSASAARPLREAGLSFVAEILQDRMSIKPCSDRVRPAGEILFC